MISMPKFEIEPYVSLALRRRWWIVIPFFLSVLGGAIFLKISPKGYKTSSLVLLEPQSIPDSFVRSTVTESIEGRLRTMTQQIQSRTNLEKLIQEFHLSVPKENPLIQKARALANGIPVFQNTGPQEEAATANNDRAALNNLVEQLKGSLQATLRGGGGGRDQSLVFEIAFQWHEPEVMAPVVNAVTMNMIEENLSIREEKAMGTTDFLDMESAAVRKELEVKEAELEAFKRDNMGMLPDQLGSNLNILNQLRDDLLSLERRLESEKQEAMILRARSQAGPREESENSIAAVSSRGARTTHAGRDARVSNDELLSGSLDELEDELSRLRASYTESHPDIAALKRRIDVLKQKGDTTQRVRPSRGNDASVTAANLQLRQMDLHIRSYETQIRELEKEIQLYKERVEKTPQVELAMTKILRDYQTVRQRYDNLLAKKLDAKMAEQLEKRRKGEQFRVLDPALKPVKPFRPDPVKTMAMALILGLGLGGGLAYLREILDPRIYNVDEIEALTDIPVMVCLPNTDMK
jgi:polysaccharide chain length determinant protein (PEP-CTERM system associated)